MIKELNGTQRDVLAWVGAGCPDGRFEGYTHRISAAALASRGLIRVSGRGPTWRAELTPRGEAVLAEPTNGDPGSNGGSGERARTKHAPLSKSEQLMAEVVAAGGALRVPYWREKGKPDYRQRALAAQRLGKVPVGKRLVLERLRGGELEIRLEDMPEGISAVPMPVPVPARLQRPHAVAARYRDNTQDHQVSRAALPRSVRIVHALAVEAERRRHQVSSPSSSRARERMARDSAKEVVAHFVLSVGGHAYSLGVSEEKVLLRGVWEERKRQADDYRRSYPLFGGERMKAYDAEATGRLTISLLASGYRREGRATTWSDRKSWKLEEKLGELLQELELRAVEDDEREAQEKREAEDRQRRWEAAMEEARLRFVEEHRANVLRAQIAARHEARTMSEYLSELEAEYGDDAQAQEWITWVRQYLERIDPLRKTPSMPAEPEISRDDLRPFLPRGMNPYGPQGW
jgi:hypothetical protein